MIEEKPIPWRELLETIFRRRWLIVGVTLAGLIIGGIAALLTPRMYRAGARILLTAQALSGPRQAAMSDRQVKAEISLLTSRSLIRSVLDDYRAQGRPPEKRRYPLQNMVEGTTARFRDLFGSEALADTTNVPSSEPQVLRGKLQAAPITRTNVIVVAYTSQDPIWAAQFINDLLKHHVARIAELNEKASASSFFQEQSSLLAVRWQETREALSAFQREQGASLLAGDETYLRSVLSRFEADLAETETHRLELSAMSQFLADEIRLLPEMITSESTITENEAVGYLGSRILELEIERSELLSRYRPTSVRIQAIDEQIEQARSLLETKQTETLSQYVTEENPIRRDLQMQLLEIETKLRGAAAKQTALKDQIADYRERLHLLERLGTELDRLKGDVENAKLAYQNYSKKQEEARLSTSLDRSGIVNVSILDPAEVPRRPVPKKTKFMLLLGGAVGFALGFVLAFVRDWLDPSLKGSAQAYRLSGIPIIAEIPSS